MLQWLGGGGYVSSAGKRSFHSPMSTAACCSLTLFPSMVKGGCENEAAVPRTSFRVPRKVCALLVGLMIVVIAIISAEVSLNDPTNQ